MLTLKCNESDKTYFGGDVESDALVAYPRLELGPLLWEKKDCGTCLPWFDLRQECAGGRDGISSKTAAQGSTSAFFSSEDGLTFSPSLAEVDVVVCEACKQGFRGTANHVRVIIQGLTNLHILLESDREKEGRR